LEDVLPTFVAAAGGEVGDDVDGTDLVDLAVSGPRDRLVVGVAHGAAGPAHVPYYLAVTDGRLKYIWYPEGPAEQLFDLEADPLEQHDLNARSESAGLVHEWRDVLRTAVRDVGGGHLLDGGELPKVAPLGDSVAEQRANAWPGYHTEVFDLDVRH
jgi:arylsulfatase